MNNILEIVIWLIGLILIFVEIIVLFLMLVTSIIYLFGYIYDLLFGNAVYNILQSDFFIIKNSKLTNYKWYKRLLDIVKLKEHYLRYETPLISFCLSYTAITIIILCLPSKLTVDKKYIVAIVIYLLSYFIGMYRRVSHIKEGDKLKKYESILENNLSFLKLSFIPISFIITIFGFLFTIMGWNVNAQHFIWLDDFFNIISQFNYLDNMIKSIIYTFVLLITFFLILYIVSLPVQVIGYFIINLIQHFRRFSHPYKLLVERYIRMIMHFIKQCF